VTASASGTASGVGPGRRDKSAGLFVLDPRRLTAPYPVGPLLVLMGFNACLLMGGALMGLQIVGIQDSYHAGLAVLVGAAVQQLQLGLLLDFPVAAAANRRNPWRFAMGGTLAFVVFAVLLGLAGLRRDTVLLYLGVFLVIAISGALTSTQHGALGQYYPVEVRTRAILAHQFVGVLSIALAAPVAFVFATGFAWQAPIFALAGLALVLVLVGRRLRPFRRDETPGEISSSAMPGGAEGPPTVPEATRVLFSVPSIKALYRALPFLSVTLLGVAFYTNLLYLNVFHQNADSRRMALDISSAGAVLGVLAAALLLPKLLRASPKRGMQMLVAGASVAAAAAVVLALSPALFVAFVANVVFMAAAAWVVAGVYAVLSVALPTRLMTLGYGMSTLWFLLGVLLIGPVGTIGTTLAAAIGADFGYRASFWLFVPLILVGAVVLGHSGRYLSSDIERLEASVKADLELRRDRVEGRGKLLVARGVEAGYDNVTVLFGIDFDIDDGEMVAVLGTNGAGKSTLAKALCGLVVPTGGEVLFDGRPITTLDPNRIVKMGIAMVPGDRGIFPGLTTSENLRMAAWLYEKDAAYVKQATKDVLGYFPALQRRLGIPAGSLSGGEQQMLSLAMAFIAQPRLLIIDELSLGLAPTVIESLLKIVKAINERGTAVVLVEQSVNLALRMTSRAVFIEKGRVVFQGSTSELVEHEEIVRSVLLGGSRRSSPGDAETTPVPQVATPSTEFGSSRMRGFASIGALRGDLAPPRSAGDGDEGDAALRALGFTKRFGGVVAVQDVSLDLADGEILGLIGPNGAGKTTVFEMISGHLRPDSGRVTMHSTDISNWPAHRRAAFGLGRSFQAARLWPGLTVQETVSVAVSRHVRSPGVVTTMLCSPSVGRAEKRVAAEAEEIIDMLGLGDFKDQLGSDLSTGVRRLLELAVIAAQRPTVVLLDEPSAGLAQAETEALAPVLRDMRAALRCSLMLIEHDMGLTRQLAHRIVALDVGAVVAAGRPDDVLRHPRVVESYLGAAAV
jgi:ABC-type branched-subunit amino acid transport system ATPase component